MENGAPLQDAIKFMRLAVENFNKLKLYVEGHGWVALGQAWDMAWAGPVAGLGLGQSQGSGRASAG